MSSMERGLLWLPLLVFFIWLTWAGWNEYHKLESYKLWAQQFERAKYDIYAVLGQSAQQLTWGLPARKGPIQLQTLAFDSIQQVSLTVDGSPFEMALVAEGGAMKTPPKGRIALTFVLNEGPAAEIPFTDLLIAQQWFEFLSPQLNRVE